MRDAESWCSREEGVFDKQGIVKENEKVAN